MVTIQPLALSYSSKYFHEPEAWRPERWLHQVETDPESPFYHDIRKGMRAFGWGPYNCVGEPLGWAWMRLIVAEMIWTFDLQKSDNRFQPSVGIRKTSLALSSSIDWMSP
jgi:cytochrome P450